MKEKRFDLVKEIGLSKNTADYINSVFTLLIDKYDKFPDVLKELMEILVTKKMSVKEAFFAGYLFGRKVQLNEMGIEHEIKLIKFIWSDDE